MLAKAMREAFALSHTTAIYFVVYLSIPESRIWPMQEEFHFSSKAEVQIWLKTFWSARIDTAVKHLAWDAGVLLMGTLAPVVCKHRCPFAVRGGHGPARDSPEVM